MNFSSTMICAIAFFIFEAGTSTRLCFAFDAFRTRVKKSAMGSVIDIESILLKVDLLLLFFSQQQLPLITPHQYPPLFAYPPQSCNVVGRRGFRSLTSLPYGRRESSLPAQG